MSTAERIKQKFKTLFEGEPRLFRSPGRINLLGEHTDYNLGYVLPASVDKAVYFAVKPREDNQVVLYAADFNESYRFDKADLRKPDIHWPWFQLAVLDQLARHGHQVSGFEAVFGGDIPSGAGMSSSAALECCLLFALNEIFSLGLTRLDIVRMGQKAENQFVGVNSGIMDQFASVFGKEDSVIQLDCRSLEYAYFPFRLEGFSLLLCDTTVKHSLAGSEYNTRRLECEKGLTILRRYFPEAESLRDVTPEQVESCREVLGDVLYRRCSFIASEIRRVVEATDFLKQGNAEGLGAKMYETHHGLQHDYEVSCPELDFLVDFSRSYPEVAGARMMGGGFGGCTINLVREEALDTYESEIKEAYNKKFGWELPCYRVRIGNGTEELR